MLFVFVVPYISRKLNDDGVLPQRGMGKVNRLSDDYLRPRQISDSLMFLYHQV